MTFEAMTLYKYSQVLPVEFLNLTQFDISKSDSYVFKCRKPKSPEILDTIENILIEKNPDGKFLLVFSDNPDMVFSLTLQGLEHVGFLVTEDPRNFQPSIYHQPFVDNRREVMVTFTGMEIPPKYAPKQILDKNNLGINAHGEMHLLIPPQNTMESDLGTVVVSATNIAALPQHVFSSIPDNTRTLNFLEQWLSGNSDIDEEQIIGYRFKDKKFKIRKMVLVARVGSPETPAMKVPTPELMRIEGLCDGKWVPITFTFRVERDVWKFLAPVEITCTPDESEDFDFTAIRLHIVKWYPGEKENMDTGLMRFHVYGEEKLEGTVRVPFFTSPEVGYLYAMYNETLVYEPEYPADPFFYMKK